MSWLLFMDESGHDHKNMPFEVRGGVALHTSKIWSFVRAWADIELSSFGVKLSDYGSEIKGSKLLKRRKWQWAHQLDPLSQQARHKGVKRFLTKSSQKLAPNQRDFSAFGQASLLMAENIFQLLIEKDAVVFASLIARGTKPPPNFAYEHYLRKDHIFLQERFFHFLESKQEHGIFVMDQTEKQQDKRFVRKVQDYYTKTSTGRQRTQWVVPSPLFVDSEMVAGVQAADLCMYCVNWGFRLPTWDFCGPKRDEIATAYGPILARLQFSGDGYRDGNVFKSYGIFYVPDPYTARE